MKEYELEKILENLWEGEIDISKAHQQVLELFNFVGRSEQLKEEVFTLANKLAIAGEGDAAVAMHRIHNRL